jgi:hypothetical protein
MGCEWGFGSSSCGAFEVVLGFVCQNLGFQVLAVNSMPFHLAHQEGSTNWLCCQQNMLEELEKTEALTNTSNGNFNRA